MALEGIPKYHRTAPKVLAITGSTIQDIRIHRTARSSARKPQPSARDGAPQPSRREFSIRAPITAIQIQVHHVRRIAAKLLIRTFADLHHRGAAVARQLGNEI